jgi:3-carboxy-cis,cis-muconate cycloisomerase
MMTHDAFGHPLLSGLFGDEEIAALLSSEASLAHMLMVESAYAEALGKVGLVPVDIAQTAAVQIKGFVPDVTGLRTRMAADGVVVPALVEQLKGALSADLHIALHKGMTSQDVVDTSLILSLSPILQVLGGRIAALLIALNDLMERFGDNALQGRTRMQAALPIKVGARIKTWQASLVAHQNTLSDISPRLLVLQLGGPVGTRAGLAPNIATEMAEILGLSDPAAAWHTNREALVEFAGWLSLVTGSLGKIGVDATLMAQQGVDEIALTGGGRSSAMPHKSNPILAETLVTLARYNATQLPGMHHALVHEQERSGSAWALEWMILPSMVMATGSALSTATKLCGSVTRLGGAN